MSKHSIPALEAARLASEKRAGLSLLPSETEDKQLDEPVSSSADEIGNKAPPRLQRGERGGVVLAPQAQLQAHKAAFREVFGETLSDEFVDEMLMNSIRPCYPGTGTDWSRQL